jgi:sarcosine oxidase
VSTHDVIVVGLGAMGSATTWQLATHGVDVLGIDRFSPPHGLGSSHGDTRITRLATAEGPEYVPLARRSQALWRDLESRTGRTLLVQCGGLVMGVPGSTSQHGIPAFADATRAVAERAGVPVEELDAGEVRRRYEVFSTTDERGILEPTAGYLLASSCISAHLEVAESHGAENRFDERVLAWTSDGKTVRVETSRGRYDAAALVVAAGPWIGELVPSIAQHFTVQRQVQYWFDAGEAATAYQRLPVFIWMHGTKPGQYFYGFPEGAGGRSGVKVATERTDGITSPDDVSRDVPRDEPTRFHSEHLDGRLPGLSTRCLHEAVCLYTVTRDFAFVIDNHPDYNNVHVVSPCSGHGFKHAAAVGEIVAELVTTGRTSIDLSAFSLARLR